MDQARFEEICDRWLISERERIGIGTQSEKSMHAILKRYFENDPQYHEIKVGRQIADIKREDEIIEIQTRELYRLKKKLSTFLVENRVTVVYPVIAKKRLFWLEPATGEVTSSRKSSKGGKAVDALAELYGLREYLNHPNFHFCVMLLEVNEYRMLDGYGKDRKKRATKVDILPYALQDEMYFYQAEDYKLFLSEALPPQFTSKDYGKTMNCPLWIAQRALNVLSLLHLIREVGKDGRYKQYEII